MCVCSFGLIFSTFTDEATGSELSAVDEMDDRDSKVTAARVIEKLRSGSKGQQWGVC